MSPKDLVSDYLARVRAKEGWESLLSDELRFTNFTHPVKRVAGKQGSIEGIRRFYSMVTALEVERIIADGKHVCALTRYELQPPGGPAFESHVAEVFEVEDGKITSLGIYFDSAPYPKPPTTTS
ncbi:MAG TPA: nuclear transport factor 2 family protein [Longimicrobiaceae bacterium]